MNELKEFEEWLKLQNKSKGTIRQYLYRLSKLPSDPKEQRAFLVNNRKKAMVIFAYRAYLKFKRNKGEITIEELHNQLETFKPPVKRGNINGDKKGRAYPKDQWPRLIQKAPHRNAKMGIWLGLQFGLRLSEIVHLRVQDINFRKKVMHIREHKENLGKGQVGWHPKYFHERDIPLNKQQEQTLKKWIQNRPVLSHPYLLWNTHPLATSERVSEISFQRWCKIADPELKVHDLRRSYATNLYKASGKDVKIVQLALGHTSVTVTSEYLQLGVEEYMDKIRSAME